MKSNFYSICLSSLLCATVASAQSGLFIDNSFTAEQMVSDFFTNSCVTPTNVTFNGAPASIGYFEAANTDLGINAGIVLSTGEVTALSQTSDVFASGFHSTPGDGDLDALGSTPSYDAAVLEFDVTVSDGGTLDFKYLFGSEEYPEFVNSAFNDVFAFFVAESGGASVTNIAMVPGVNSVPVAINNVNEFLNTEFYNNYGANLGQHIVFDGLTTLLPATFEATASATYHIKIAVADVADAAFDSGVLIGIESLCGNLTITPPALAQGEVDGNTVVFTNESRYATSWHWDFGDGFTSNERYPQPHTYATDGIYTVTLTTQNWCCVDVKQFAVTIGNPSGTSETKAKPFALYPNPASETLFVEPKSGETMEFELYNASGSLLFSGIAEGKTEIHTGAFQSGVYTLMLKGGSGFFVEKIIVN